VRTRFADLREWAGVVIALHDDVEALGTLVVEARSDRHAAQRLGELALAAEAATKDAHAEFRKLTKEYERAIEAIHDMRARGCR
jgi:hypothetical protein